MAVEPKKSKLEIFVSADVDKKDKEPAIRTGISVAAVAGVITAILNVFFPKLMTEEVKTALYSILIIIIPFITAFLIRRKVWSPASVEEVIEEATKSTEEVAKQQYEKRLQAQALQSIRESRATRASRIQDEPKS